jgi:hypothetical protein
MHPRFSGARTRLPRSHSAATLAILFAVALVPLIGRPAAAAWLPQGTALDTRAGDHVSPLVVPDGAAGAYVVWSHSDPTTHVRVQHLTANGEPAGGWSVGGMEIATAGPARTLVGAGPDGAGGLVAGWLETGTGVAMRLQPDGAPAAGWGAGGNVFWSLGAPPSYNQYPTWFGADGAGGAWFVNQSNSQFCPDICYGSSSEVVQRIGSTGVVADPYGSVCSSTTPNGTYLQYASPPEPGRVLTSGSAAFSSLGYLTMFSAATGVVWAVTVAPQNSTVLGSADDGAGGALLVVEGDIFGDAPPHLIRRDASGASAPGWLEAGTPFRVPSASLAGVEAISDGVGGILIGWTEAGAAGNEFRLQRMTNAGAPAPGWPAEGVLVNDAPGAHSDLRLAADGEGGAFIAWSDRRSDSEGDVFATHIRTDGSLDPAFAPNGTGIAIVPGSQTNIDLALVSPGHAVLAWEDARDPVHRVVYAQLLTVEITLGSPPAQPRRLALAGFTPNPARGDIHIAFRLPVTGDVTLELFDLLGRRLERAEFSAMAAGDHRVMLSASPVLPAGLYLVRLRAGGEERTARGLLAR